ncbi:type II secretory pathway, component PulF [Rothia mucilaginosa DY-18]|uniref:Type II secretory pathway, component PulF n=1 Tax=Rothia mucilaginosa (strain DY-18) TaxID=680646 RepID=D2NSQ2_ROTMD|nr:type II secretory pathway, component PulF [Rothia mucilaginosa DY-18]
MLVVELYLLEAHGAVSVRDNSVRVTLTTSRRVRIVACLINPAGHHKVVAALIQGAPQLKTLKAGERVSDVAGSCEALLQLSLVVANDSKTVNLNNGHVSSFC